MDEVGVSTVTAGLERSVRGFLDQSKDESVSTTTLVRFAIGDVILATPLSSVAAVMAASSMTRDVGASHIPGVIGRVPSPLADVDVIDGAALIEVGADVETPRVLVLRGHRPLGITVSQVLESHEAADGDVVRYNETVARRLDGVLACGLLWRGDSPAELLLDVQAVLGAGNWRNPSRNHSAEGRMAVAERYRALDRSHLLEISLAGSHERWGVPMNAIRHVAEYRVPLRLPGAPPDVHGLLSWQRHPVPVIDPAHRIGLDLHDPRRSRLLVVGPPGETTEEADAAFIVATVRGLHASMQIDGDLASNQIGDQLRVLNVTGLLQP